VDWWCLSVAKGKRLTQYEKPQSTKEHLGRLGLLSFTLQFEKTKEAVVVSR
jgi:hypothetical protein